MQHWVEPGPLADAQRTGYNSPTIPHLQQGPQYPRGDLPGALNPPALPADVPSLQPTMSGLGMLNGGGVLGYAIALGIGFWLGKKFGKKG